MRLLLQILYFGKFSDNIGKGFFRKLAASYAMVQLTDLVVAGSAGEIVLKSVLCAKPCSKQIFGRNPVRWF